MSRPSPPPPFRYRQAHAKEAPEPRKTSPAASLTSARPAKTVTRQKTVSPAPPKDSVVYKRNVSAAQPKPIPALPPQDTATAARKADDARRANEAKKRYDQLLELKFITKEQYEKEIREIRK